MIPPREVRELNLRDYFEIIRKRKWLVSAVILGVIGIVAFYDFVFPKVYKATTTILIEKEIPRITERGEDIYVKEIRDQEYYQTQYNLLKSRSLAERVIKKLNLTKDPAFVSAVDPIQALLSKVKIEPIRLSNLIEISVTGRDPLKITNIANAWSREYIQQDIEKKIGVAKYGVSWLEDQLSDILNKLQESEEELNQFIRKNKIINIPDIEEQLKESLIDNLKGQKAQLEKEIEKALKRYKEKHPKMISLRAQLSAVEKEIKKETESLLSIQEITVEYKLLKRKVDTYNSLYEDLLNRAKDLDLSKEMTLTNIRVVDVAEVPKSPIKPSPKRDLIIAIFFSLFLSGGLCIFLEYQDSSLKTSEDIELYVKIPFLGYVPSARREAKDQKEMDLLSQLKPRSRVAEAFRNIRASLIFSSPQDKPLKSLVITSSVPEEGKTFIASNLAVISALANEPTLLIDADMRKGRLSKSFGIEGDNRGLSSVLTGVGTLEEAVISTDIPHLSLLNCGPPTPNPTELLSSEKLREILRIAGAGFRRVIIDAPPILGVADTLIIGDICDGLALVIKANRTPLKHINDAKRTVEKNIKIVGGILNDIEVGKDSYYYYHYYEQGSPSEEKK